MTSKKLSFAPLGFRSVNSVGLRLHMDATLVLEAGEIFREAAFESVQEIPFWHFPKESI